MSIRDRRYYEIENPSFLKDETRTEAETATLEVAPVEREGTLMVEFSAIAKMETGRDRSVEGHLDRETARELHAELGELLEA